MKTNKIIVSGLVAVLLLSGQALHTTSEHIECNQVKDKQVTTNISKVQYTPFDTPNVNSSFKPYMDYRTITDKKSKQYKLIHEWGWADQEGFMRCNGEIELGIRDDYYLIALGSYYGTEIGTKYRITTSLGKVFYGVLADCKSDIHTNLTNQHGKNNDIVEFLVDESILNGAVKYHGSANVCPLLEGKILSIEKIDFTEL